MFMWKKNFLVHFRVNLAPLVPQVLAQVVRSKSSLFVTFQFQQNVEVFKCHLCLSVGFSGIIALQSILTVGRFIHSYHFSLLCKRSLGKYLPIKTQNFHQFGHC